MSAFSHPKDVQPQTTQCTHDIVPVHAGFGSYFHDAPQNPGGARQLHALDRLAAAMPLGGTLDTTAALRGFARFTSRDLMANGVSGPDLGPLDSDDLRPLPRTLIEQCIVNRNSGTAGLETVYGDGPNAGPLSLHLSSLLRDPLHKRRLWLGSRPATGPGRPATLSPQRAACGLGYAWLHNRIADRFGAQTDPEVAFAAARRLTRWHHQWLVLNALLPAICDPLVLAHTLAHNAPLYGGFLQLHAPGVPGLMPLPFEFAAAADRIAPTRHAGTARRLLRLGHRLNLACAQDCIAGLHVLADIEVDPLSVEELVAGVDPRAVIEGGFVERTPLWFYLAQEAAQRGRGRLGPLGSHLMAETLAGVILHDPDSVWHRPGPDDLRDWKPSQIDGQPVDSIPALLALAGFA